MEVSRAIIGKLFFLWGFERFVETSLQKVTHFRVYTYLGPFSLAVVIISHLFGVLTCIYLNLNFMNFQINNRELKMLTVSNSSGDQLCFCMTFESRIFLFSGVWF